MDEHQTLVCLLLHNILNVYQYKYSYSVDSLNKNTDCYAKGCQRIYNNLVEIHFIINLTHVCRIKF